MTPEERIAWVHIQNYPLGPKYVQVIREAVEEEREAILDLMFEISNLDDLAAAIRERGNGKLERQG